MSTSQVLRSTNPTVVDARRPGLFGGLGRTLAAGLVMYRGWHS